MFQSLETVAFMLVNMPARLEPTRVPSASACLPLPENLYVLAFVESFTAL